MGGTWGTTVLGTGLGGSRIKVGLGQDEESLGSGQGWAMGVLTGFSQWDHSWGSQKPHV